MIELTKADLGRQVIHYPPGPEPNAEQGEVVSYDDERVLVKFGKGTKPCRREDLEWTYQGREL